MRGSHWVIPLALAACGGGPPLHPALSPAASAVRIQWMDEAGDAWLHERCVYKGLLPALYTDDQAKAEAEQANANFVEPIQESASRFTNAQGQTSSSPSTYRVALFRCEQLPPRRQP